jgi:hypothetical protein
MKWLVVFRLWASAFAVAALALLFATSNQAAAQDAASADLTFEGTAETGGTISLTITPDRTGIIRAELRDVPFSTVGLFDPPESITDGAFGLLLFLRRDESGIFSGVVLDGAIAADGTIAGTFHSVGMWVSPGGPHVGEGPDVAWNAEVVDRPPAPDDLAFVGTVEDGAGTITLTVDAARTGLTSLTLDALSLPSCAQPGNPLDIRTFFDPPVALSSPIALRVYGYDQASQSWPFDYASVDLTGAFVDQQSLEGTLEVDRVVAGCTADLRWNAQFVPPTTPIPSLTPAASQTRQPTATVIPAIDLPRAGAGGDASGGTVRWLIGAVASMAAAAVCGALLLRVRHP